MTSIQFPGWFYGPDGQSQIFESIEDVPQGWEDHPSKLKDDGKDAEKTPNPPNPTSPTYSPLNKEQVIAELDKKSMSELWGLAKKIEVTKDGKKPDLVKRIADKLLILDNED